MASSITAVADDATGTVQITVQFPTPVDHPIHVIRVHPDGSEHEVVGSPVYMSNGFAVLYDNGAPMDVPVFYQAYSAIGLVASTSFNYTVDDGWNPGALSLPGTAGNYASTPDAASLDIVGDIDVRARIQPDTWTPGADQTIISKWNTTAAQRSWHFTLNSTGLLAFSWSTDGTGAGIVNAISTVATGFQPELIRWVRATFEAATGTVNFYTSDNGASWAPLGAPVVMGASSIFASTAAVNVGGRSAGTTNLFDGLIFSAQIIDGIGTTGTVVADPMFNQQGPTITSFVDSTGKTWTLNGTAAIVERPMNLDWDLINGAATDYNVVNGVGQQIASTTNVIRFSTVDVGLEDVTVVATVSIDQAPITGNTVNARVWAHFTDVSNYWEAQISWSTTGDVGLILNRRQLGVLTPLTSLVNFATGAVANQLFTIKFKVEGIQLSAKAWRPELELEPADWMLSVADAGGLPSTSIVGVGNRRETGNTNANLVFSWHDFYAYGPAAQQPARTLRYTFAQTDEGWVGEGSTSVAWVASPAYSSPGALAATKTMGSGFDSLRFNDNDQLPQNLMPWGNTFTAWVLVPEGTPGSNFLGRLEVQDSAFNWVGEDDVPLIPGVWTPLRLAAQSTTLEDAHSIGVQIGMTGADAEVTVYLDSVYQTFNAVSNYVLIEAAPDGWLKSPTIPTLDIRIDNCEVHSPSCLQGDQLVFFKALDVEENASASGVFDIVNRANPFVVGQTRKGIRTTLVLISRRLVDITAIRKLLAPGTPLILDLPAIYGWGIETYGQDWVQIGDINASRLGADMRKPYRTWSMPLAVVDEGIAHASGNTGGNGIGAPGTTWGDLAATGLTWGQVAATGEWWMDLAQGEGF